VAEISPPFTSNNHRERRRASEHLTELLDPQTRAINTSKSAACLEGFPFWEAEKRGLIPAVLQKLNQNQKLATAWASTLWTSKTA